MRVPISIRIHGVWTDVNYSDKEEKGESESDSEHLSGYFENEQIYISKSVSLVKLVPTLGHECFHAMLYHSGQDKIIKSIDKEEALAQMFQSAFCSFLAFSTTSEDIKWGEVKFNH